MIRVYSVWTAIAAVLLLCATTTGCSRPRGSTPDPPTRRSRTAAADGPRHVHHWTVKTRLESSPAIGSFARLTPDQRRHLDSLIDRSTIPIEISAAQGRVLVTLPYQHPGGPVELLLAEDMDRIFVFHPQRKLSHDVPLDRLPDLLDGHEASVRSDFVAEIEAPPPQQRPPTRTALLGATISLRYNPRPGHPLSWPIQQRVTLVFPDTPRPFYSVFQQPLLSICLPLLQSSLALELLQAQRGALVLESLAWNLAAPPQSWTTTLSNEGNPGGAAPTFHSKVVARGWVPVPPDRLSTSRHGYRNGRRWVQAAGIQLVPPTQLAGLRATRTTGALTISNRGRYLAQIYADGALLGWVTPGKTFAFRGLPDGYYRLYAVSPTGVRYWGPHDQYVPGPWTLR